MNFSEYSRHDATGLAELVRKGEVSADELLAVACARLAELNPQLNCVIHTFEEAARARVRAGLPDGPFAGVPFILKDLLDDLEGQPTSFGTNSVRWLPPRHAEITGRYLRAGLVPFAKSNLPELGLMISTEPQAFGPAHNPWKAGHSTGGSSGGSAAAVAARIVPMASANDGGGSIRFPAACCGIFGLKPSRGRNPFGPFEAEGWDGAIAGHPVTLSVRDSAAMLDALSGAEPGQPYVAATQSESFLTQMQRAPAPLTIGYSFKPMVPATVSAEARAAVERTLALLEDAGHQLVEADPQIDSEKLWADFLVVTSGHVANKVAQIRREFGAAAARGLEPGTLSMAMLGRSFRSVDVAAAKEGWHRARLAMSDYFSRFDLLLTPTLIGEPAPHGVIPPTAFEALQMRLGQHLPLGRLLMASGLLFSLSERVLSRMAFTVLGNVTGLPAMSVPLYWTPNGLPLGSQFMAPMGQEGRLLQLAHQLEQQAPWFDKRPSL